MGIILNGINYSPIIEAMRIGRVAISINDEEIAEEELTIEVYPNECDVPHFHFFTKDKKISGCLQIFKPEYFICGNDKSELTNTQLKQLVSFLNDEKYQDVNNWRLTVFAWAHDENKEIYKKMNLKNVKDPSDIINMPDYLKLLK